MAAQGESRVRKSTDAELRRVKPFMRWMSAANVWVFRATGGRLGSRFRGGAPVGLLTTVGRKSGARRTLPLIFLEDGGRIVLVASQGGLPKHPLWYRNLVENPQVEFQHRGSPAASYRARTASAEEKRALWPRLCAIYAPYESYQKRTDREIPVVVLEPTRSS